MNFSIARRTRRSPDAYVGPRVAFQRRIPDRPDRRDDIGEPDRIDVTTDQRLSIAVARSTSGHSPHAGEADPQRVRRVEMCSRAGLGTRSECLDSDVFRKLPD